jgi:orotate phosphoribosyltransferase
MTTAVAQERAALKEMLLKSSVRFGDFTLVSGQKSDVYVDCKLTAYLPAAMPLIGRAVLEKIRGRGWEPEAVGGLTLGADPIAFAVARESLDTERPIPAFVARKEPKKHGTQRFIEGMEKTEGLAVVVLDDVCTTGGSTVQAIERVRNAGMRVLGAVCLVDREMGATELLAAMDCPLDSVFKLSELRR